jgi:hypothetical protein
MIVAFEVVTALKMSTLVFGLWRWVALYVDASVSEKHTVSTFSGEVGVLECWKFM